MSDNSSSSGTHSGKAFAKNTFTSLLAQGAPALIGLVAVPFLLKRLGLDRFGILSVSWMLIGYLSLFDLGMGRVLTKVVAEKLSLQDREGAKQATWSVLRFMFLFSLIVSACAVFATPLIIKKLLIIPENIQHEATVSFYLLCIAIPFVTLSSALRGVLDAYHDFGSANITQSISGFGNFILPAVCAALSTSLVPVIISLVFIRLFSFFMFLFQVVRISGRPDFSSKHASNHLVQVLKLGGWITLSNIVGPIISYFDRGILGSFLEIGKLSYYTTPYDVATRFWIVPTAVTRVLMPLFSSLQVGYEEKLAPAFDRGLRTIFLGLALPVFIVVTFAPELIKLWLGQDFALNSAPVARWIFIGILINSLSWVPFVFLLACGHHDYPAKLTIISAAPYLGALYLGVKYAGAPGAAFVWTLGFVANIFFMFLRCQKRTPSLKPFLLRRSAEVFIFCIITLCISIVPELPTKFLAALGFVPCLGVYAWCKLSLPNEKDQFLLLVRKILKIKKVTV